MQPQLSRRKFTAVLTGALVGSARAQDSTIIQCRQKMLMIYEAIRVYQGNHNGEFPRSLTSLHPKYIADLNTLGCPIAIADGDFQIGNRFIDPYEHDALPSYVYELTDRKVKSWLDGKTVLGTERDLKFKQAMSPVGRRVPIVRCLKHEADIEKSLNIGMNGQFYEAHSYWESEFCDLFPQTYLIPDFIFRSHAPLSEQAPARDPVIEYDPDMVDLTPHYNALLTDCWRLAIAKDDLSSLATENQKSGSVELNGIRFDIRGVVQLDGRTVKDRHEGFTCPMFARSVQGISIGRSVSRIHLLHAVLFPESTGTEVANLTLHYHHLVDQEIVLRYGDNTGCWKSSLDQNLPRGKKTELAWMAPHPASEPGDLRLYKTTIETNSGTMLDTIDFTSAMSKAAPFVVAMTTE